MKYLYQKEYDNELSNIENIGANNQELSQILSGGDYSDVGIDLYNLEKKDNVIDDRSVPHKVFDTASSVFRGTARTIISPVEKAVRNILNVGVATINKVADKDIATLDEPLMPMNEITRNIVGDSFFKENYSNIWEDAFKGTTRVGYSLGSLAFGDENKEATQQQQKYEGTIESKLFGSEIPVSGGVKELGYNEINQFLGLGEESNWNYVAGIGAIALEWVGRGNKTKTLQELSKITKDLDDKEEIYKVLSKATSWNDNVLKNVSQYVSNQKSADKIFNKFASVEIKNLLSSATKPVADLKVLEHKYTKQELKNNFAENLIKEFKKTGLVEDIELNKLKTANKGDEVIDTSRVWLNEEKNRDFIRSIQSKYNKELNLAKDNFNKKIDYDSSSKLKKEITEKLKKTGLKKKELEKAVETTSKILTNPTLKNTLGETYGYAIATNKSVSQQKILNRLKTSKENNFIRNKKTFVKKIKENLDKSFELKKAEFSSTLTEKEKSKLLKDKKKIDSSVFGDAEKIADNILRFSGKTETILERLDNMGIPRSVVDEFVLENGVKLKDTVVIKRDKTVGALRETITKQELEKLSTSYRNKTDFRIDPNENNTRLKRVKNSKPVKALSEFFKNFGDSLTLTRMKFEGLGFGYIYDDIRFASNQAQKRKQDIKDYLAKNNLLAGTTTNPKLNITQKERVEIFNYITTKTAGLPKNHKQYKKFKNLSRNSKQIIKAFEYFRDKTNTARFSELAKQGVNVGFRADYFPTYGSKDYIKQYVPKTKNKKGYWKEVSIGDTKKSFAHEATNWKDIPDDELLEIDFNEIWNNDVSNVMFRWIDDTSKAIDYEPTVRKYQTLFNSDEALKIVNGDKGKDLDYIKETLQYYEKDPELVFSNAPVQTASSFFGMATATSALLFNLTTLALQGLSLITVSLINGAKPALVKNKYLKTVEKIYGKEINITDVSAYSKRGIADPYIEDVQGKIGKYVSALLSNTIGSVDRFFSGIATRGLLNKYAKELVKNEETISKDVIKSILETAGKNIDNAFGGLDKIERPTAFRNEIMKHIMVFTYPLISQNNTILFSALRNDGLKKEKALAYVRAFATFSAIVYTENVIRNLDLTWYDNSDKNVENILGAMVGATGVPLISGLPWMLETGEWSDIAPILSTIDNLMTGIYNTSIAFSLELETDGLDEFDKQKAEARLYRKKEQALKQLARGLGIPNTLYKQYELYRATEQGYLVQGRDIIPFISFDEYVRLAFSGRYGTLAVREYFSNKDLPYEERNYENKVLELVVSPVDTEERAINSAKNFMKLNQIDRLFVRDFINNNFKSKMDIIDRALIEHFGDTDVVQKIPFINTAKAITFSEQSVENILKAEKSFVYISQKQPDKKAEILTNLSLEARRSYAKWELANNSLKSGSIKYSDLEKLYKDLGYKNKPKTNDLENIVFKSIILKRGLPASIIKIKNFQEELTKNKELILSDDKIKEYNSYALKALQQDKIPKSVIKKYTKQIININNRRKAKKELLRIKNMFLSGLDFKTDIRTYFNGLDNNIKKILLKDVMTLKELYD